MPHYRHPFIPSISTKRKHQRLQVLPLLVSTTRSDTATIFATTLTISARLEMTFTAPEMTYRRSGDDLPHKNNYPQRRVMGIADKG